MAALAMVLDNIMGCVNTGCYKAVDIREEALKAHVEVVVPLLKCQGCASNYCDDRVPRSLPCGHTQCTPCVTAMVAEDKPCPECRLKQKTKVNEVPVNYQLLRLTRNCKINEIKVGSGNRAILFADVSKFNMKDDLGKCSVHDSPNVLFCRSCNVWACENCLVLDHPLPPRGTCRVLQLTDAIDQIRRKYEEVALNMQKDIDTMKADFQLEFGMHDFCLKHCTEERSHQRLVKILEPLLLGKSEENDEAVKKANERLKKITDSFRVAVSPDVISAACKELLDFQEELKPVVKEEKERLQKARPSMLKHFNMEIKRLVERGVPLYATYKEEVHGWSYLSLIDGKLLLSCLNEGTPPSDGIIIPYQYMEMMLDDKENTLFIEVGTDEGTPLGRVFIKLTGSNPLTQQMFLMCSGQKGVSLRNTKLFQNEKHRLSGGDYLKSDGSKGGTIVQGLGDCYTRSFYIGEKKKGGVLGETFSTRFHILLNSPNEYFAEALGMVTEGLQVVKAAASSDMVTRACIKDCGVFIPMMRRFSESSDDEKKEEEEDTEDDTPEEF